MQRTGPFLFVLVISFVFPPAVHAYLDPGSGSMLLQVLLGGAAGLAVLIKLYWQRVLLLFGIGQEENPDKEVAQTAQAIGEADQQE